MCASAFLTTNNYICDQSANYISMNLQIWKHTHSKQPISVISFPVEDLQQVKLRLQKRYFPDNIWAERMVRFKEHW